MVPCGPQPANLVESAFFGHVNGAFTGADRPKVGKFEAAGNGTILLDEIDTLALEQQAGLLRVIETRRVRAGRQQRDASTAQARIIVASNWDLEEAVRQGKFRQDLYYRLNVMSFHLPPLRERVQDIAPLVRGMAARFNTKFRKDLFDVNPRRMDALEGFPWPGNIRQLENVVQQAVLVSSGAGAAAGASAGAGPRSTGPRNGTPVPATAARHAGPQPRSDWNATSSSARLAKQRLQPVAGRRRPGHQPRDAVQEDEEVWADGDAVRVQWGNARSERMFHPDHLKSPGLLRPGLHGESCAQASGTTSPRRQDRHAPPSAARRP